jgi:glycosyltransferase involved in cell wall biosynthesis
MHNNSLDSSAPTCHFVVDTRLSKNGLVYWDPRQSFPRGHWDESINAFERIVVIARTQATDDVCGDKVSFLPSTQIIELPYYVGPLAALLKVVPLLLRCRLCAAKNGLFILRIPGFIPMIMWLWLRTYGKGYAVEVLGDPREVFEVVDHPLHRLWKCVYGWGQRKMIEHARAVLYISKTLALRYPACEGSYSVVASDVRLDATVYSGPRTYLKPLSPVRLVHIGTMDQPYKGHRHLFKAIKICRESGCSAEVVLIGNGRLRPSFEKICTTLGISDLVCFSGSVAWGPALFQFLDNADIFVMPSLTEGLGKALIEAMARGLPAIGSDVGGIPELLSRDALVPPGDEHALAERIMELARDPTHLTEMSARNFEVARRYRNELLTGMRLDFYKACAQATDSGLGASLSEKNQ